MGPGGGTRAIVGGTMGRQARAGTISTAPCVGTTLGLAGAGLAPQADCMPDKGPGAKALVMVRTMGLVSANSTAFAGTALYDQVKQYWMEGRVQAVLNLAHQRLQQDPRHSVGLTLEFQSVGRPPGSACDKGTK